MRACGNIGVANEKSVPAKGVGAGGERYSVLKTDGVCMPAQTHGVGVAWEGGWAVCGSERWMCMEGCVPEDYQRDMCGGGERLSGKSRV